MPIFSWKGIDSCGNSLSGNRMANDATDLKNQLMLDGVALLDAKVRSKTLTILNDLLVLNRPSTNEIANFFEQLSVLIGGGVELLTALRIVSTQANSPRIKGVIDLLKMDVEHGNALSIALSMQSNIFSDFIIQMVKVAEESEKLALVLNEISDHLKKKCELRRDLVNSASVPIFTLLFAVFIILAIFIFVVPQFKNFFESMGKNIPSSTKKLIAMSDFLRSGKMLICIGVLISFVAILFLLPAGTKIKKIKDYLLLSLPFFSKLIMLSEVVGFLQSLNLLLNAGLPLRNATLTARSAVSNYYFREKLTLIADSMVTGKSFADSLGHLQDLYQFDMLKSLIIVGEQAGNLNASIEKATDFFRNELKRTMALTTSFFQPILLVVVGIIVGALIWIIYLPIINLAYTLN